MSDNVRLRGIIASLIENEGHPVLMASNGIDAIELVEACLPMAVVVESLASGVTIANLVESLSACFGDERPPVIALLAAGETPPVSSIGIVADSFTSAAFLALLHESLLTTPTQSSTG